MRRISCLRHNMMTVRWQSMFTSATSRRSRITTKHSLHSLLVVGVRTCRLSMGVVINLELNMGINSTCLLAKHSIVNVEVSQHLAKLQTNKRNNRCFVENTVRQLSCCRKCIFNATISENFALKWSSTVLWCL